MILIKKLFNTSEAFEKVRKGQGNGERGGALLVSTAKSVKIQSIMEYAR